MKLNPQSGTLKGLAIMLSVDGKCIETIKVDTRDIPLRQANEVELDVRPVFEVER